MMKSIEMDIGFPFGFVESVDTASVIILVSDEDALKSLQVNHLVTIKSAKVAQHLIGSVVRILRKGNITLEEDAEELVCSNVIKVLLLGTFYERLGDKFNVFKRTLESVPSIGAECRVLKGSGLTDFMKSIADSSTDAAQRLSLGRYTLDDDAVAYLDGNKFFQRHAVIVGSTGSGKSYTVAKLIEGMSELPSCNAVLFDLHGEYHPLKGEKFTHYKVAGPSDTPDTERNLFLPYWLMTYEEMTSFMLDRSDNDAPNQASEYVVAVREAKERSISDSGNSQYLDGFTIDSPIPFDINHVLDKMRDENTKRIPGAKMGTDKQGPLFGKLSNFIHRFETKLADRRLNFFFCAEKKLMRFDYMNSLCSKLMLPYSSSGHGIKIVDFSEVPSDILPLVVSMFARLIFSVQQWTRIESRNPICILCDEAHLYIPEHNTKSTDIASVEGFERISKEGRKYGISLVVISQRPSEVNRTVLSQSNNFIAMRLTNAEDQSVIKRLLPDSLGGYAELLPILDVGEAIVVGDASLLPTRIKIGEPRNKPASETIKFWDKWASIKSSDSVSDAIDALRVQRK